MEKLADSMKLPKDLRRGTVVVTAFGNKELHIENHRGILMYEKDCVKILARPGRVEITGTDLVIDFYNNEEINIKGRIAGIQYT